MRKLITCVLLLVTAAAPAAMTTVPAGIGAGPEIAYWIDNYVIADKATQFANVYYHSDYYLEDGTHIGADATGWYGHDNNSLISQVSAAIWSGIGGMVGWNFGSWAANWAASQVAIGASNAWYWMGLGALAAGPWVGFIVGTAMGVA